MYYAGNGEAPPLILDKAKIKAAAKRISRLKKNGRQSL